MTQVDFAIITIREDEFDAVLQRFTPRAQKGDKTGRTYGVTQVMTQAGQDCNIAVVRCPEQGLNTAQQVASDLIQDFDLRMLLVVGIAGGVPSADFTLGDVIISNRIDNFSVGKRDIDGSERFAMRSDIDPIVSDITASLPLYKERFANWSNSIELPRPKVNLKQFKTVSFKQKTTDDTNSASSKWYKDLEKYTKKHFSDERKPLYITGRIASSNNVVRNIDLMDKWLQDARNISAVEMEAAGVLQAAQGIIQRYPVMAIRGISDIIGLEREDEWTKYACQTAAAFTYAFVAAGIIPPRGTSTISNSASGSSSVAPPPAQPAQAQGNTLADRNEQPISSQSKNIQWKDVQRTLRIRLGELYPHESAIRIVVREVDDSLEPSILWSGSAANCWSEILRQAKLRDLVLELIDRALLDFSQDKVLQKAKADFQTLTLG